MNDEITPDGGSEESGETSATPSKPSEAPTVGAGDATAELERLRVQLAEAAPIVQAHKDAEEARKTDEQKLRDELEAIQRERGEAQRGLLLHEVAEETGLSADVIAIIQRAVTTKDELLSAASVIAEHTKRSPAAPKRPTPRVGGGVDAAPADSGDFDAVKIAQAIAKRIRL
ncbi:MULTISPECIES: hypothetical protein [Streptomyces]|uniref:hypothetical protein n=1 Tax=Streptomyces TaxID=1883 RepID=UPI000B9EE4F5|nr:hypothetical protein [Streptomyces kasugaensis]